jgi:uncharacterized protein (DUF58 family)
VKEPILDKQLAIKLQVKKYVLGQFLGLYRSLFRGKGIEYDEIRKYVPGDDRKAIVWAKLAQLGEAYVKTFLEERDLTVIVALDTSSSVFWSRPQKSLLALEVASLLLFSAAISRDRVGLALFSNGVESFSSPRRGLQHAGKLVGELSQIEISEKKTCFLESFRGIGARRGPKRSVMFIISDFLTQETGWEKELVLLSRQNDLILVRVTDQWEENPPQVGWIYAQDPESGRSQFLHCDKTFSENVQQKLRDAARAFHRLSTQFNLGCVEMVEGCDPAKTLRAFFEQRCRLLRRR